MTNRTSNTTTGINRAAFSQTFSQTQDSDLRESALYSELSIDDVTVNAATNVQQQLPPDLRTRREVVVDHRIIGPGDRTSELPTSTRAVQ